MRLPWKRNKPEPQPEPIVVLGDVLDQARAVVRDVELKDAPTVAINGIDYKLIITVTPTAGTTNFGPIWWTWDDSGKPVPLY